MLVDLVHVRTADGVRLDGAWQTTATGVERRLCVDALLCLHGTGSNFYSSAMFESLAPKFLADGSGVLCVNTRGHDLAASLTVTAGPRRGGAAYECVDDCRHDLAAWIDWLVAQGRRSIGLIGHSLGAVKAVIALADQSHPAVSRLVAISPPRLAYSQFAASLKRDEFLATLATAEEHVSAGQPETLMQVRFPLSYLVTAAGYVDKYGPAERYDILKWIAGLPCPALFTFGGAEVRMEAAFQSLPTAVTQAALPGQDVQVAVIEDANHIYSRHLDELAHKLRAWLAAKAPS